MPTLVIGLFTGAVALLIGRKIGTVLRTIREQNDTVTEGWFKEHEYREGTKGFEQ